ncbi:MAG: hypothetical protein RL621_332 [Bacteroidota bacterium]|jgi:hypothetical protein
MKNSERLLWITVMLFVCLFKTSNVDAEWDTWDASRFRDLLEMMQEQTKAQKSIANSLDTIAKKCK